MFHPTSSLGFPAAAPSIAALAAAPAGEITAEPQATPTAVALSAAIADQLSYHVIRSVAGGGEEFVLRLRPPELGDVTVHLLVDHREVSAWFASPQIPVQQAITDAIGQLQTDLGKAGYYLAGAWVGAEAWRPRERDGSSGMPQQQRNTANRPKLAESSGSPAPTVASGVSIFV